VTKPIDPRELYAALLRYLPRRQGLPAWVEPAADAQSDERGPVGTDVPGLDVPAGLARVGGDATLYVQLLGQFRTQYAEHPAAIRLALGGGDLAQVRALAHALRGVAGNLSAVDVERAAANLEAAVTDSLGAERLLGLIEKLSGALTALSAAQPGLDALAGAAAGAAAGDDPAPAADFRAGLKALAEALRSRRPKACTAALAALRGVAWPAAAGAGSVDAKSRMAQISILAGRFKYAEALTLTQGLLDGLPKERAS
jgi:HPt (histidine-containing phosphotransfer) domain-containing protein